MNNQTIKKDPSNRLEKADSELFKRLRTIWQGWQGSNPRHAVLETAALPTELHPYDKGAG